jgi:hypothetical protein
MEFEGTVVNLLPQVKGTSARGEWVKQEVIFEQTGEFGRKLCVSFWGDKAQDAMGLHAGDRVKVSANLESREYNGRWYTEVRAWKMDKAAAAQGAPAPMSGDYDWGAPAPSSSMGSYASGAGSQAATQAAPATSAEEFDDLPF